MSSSSLRNSGQWSRKDCQHEVISPAGVSLQLSAAQILILKGSSQYNCCFVSWSTSVEAHFDVLLPKAMLPTLSASKQLVDRHGLRLVPASKTKKRRISSLLQDSVPAELAPCNPSGRRSNVSLALPTVESIAELMEDACKTLPIDNGDNSDSQKSEYPHWLG